MDGGGALPCLCVEARRYLGIGSLSNMSVLGTRLGLSGMRFYLLCYLKGSNVVKY